MARKARSLRELGVNDDNYDNTLLTAYHQNTIHLEGMAQNGTLYNQWRNELNMLPWVSTSTHIRYEDTDMGYGIFVLELRVK